MEINCVDVTIFHNLPASFLHTMVGWGTPVTLQGNVISWPSTTSSSCGFVTHSGGTLVSS